MRSILGLLGNNTQAELNGAARVLGTVAKITEDVTWETAHCLRNNALNKHDLIVLFGAAAANHVLGKQPLKIQRRSLHRNSHGQPCTVTFDAEAAESSNQWTKTLVEDVLWGLGELQLFRKKPSLATTHAACGTLIGFDLETVGSFEDPICGRILTVAVDEMGTAHDIQSFLESLQEVDHFRTIAGHNIKYDLKWALREGVDLTNLPLHDTEIAAALLDDNIADNSLAFLTSRCTNIPYFKDMVDRANLDKENIGDVVMYNKFDAIASREVAEVQEVQLQEQGFGPIFELLMDLIPVYVRMETRGVNIDRDLAREIRVEVREQMASALEVVGVDQKVLSSPKQLRELLYEEKGYKVYGKTGKGLPSTDANALERIFEDSPDPFIQGILDYRDAEKIDSTYLAKLPVYTQFDGRIHPDYSLAVGEFGGAKTGRTSCRRPNLQNIPRGHSVRKIYVPSPGYLWGKADHSQLELRIGAWLSGDEVMLAAFREGNDIHTATMARLFGKSYGELEEILGQEDPGPWYERRVATKRVNFGILYGVGAKKLAAILWKEGIYMTVAECQDLIDRWRDTYKGFERWKAEIENNAVLNKQITTVTGRRRTLPDANHDTFDGWRALRQAVNFPIQSTASDITQIGMYLMDKEFRNHDAHLLMNVHDEINWEFRDIDPDHMAEMAKHLMEDATKDEFKRRFGAEITVPLQADPKIGERWS